MYLVTFLFQGQLLGGWFEAALFVVGVAVVVLQLWQGAGSRSSAKETALGLVEKDRDDMIGKCTVSTRTKRERERERWRVSEDQRIPPLPFFANPESWSRMIYTPVLK